MSDTISKIKLNGTTYIIDDLSKASIESVLELGEITSENNSLLTFANSKLDELLNRINCSIKSQDFYKCAAVDFSANTWDGYKAVLNNGIYEFEKTLTTGMSYGEAFTPIKGRVYDATCTVVVSSLYNGLPEGLVFYAPFESDISEAETGQELKAVGVSYGKDGDIGYVSITDSSTYISADDAGFPAGNEDRTIICLMRTTGEYSDPFPFLGYGQSDHECNFYLSIENNRFGFDTNNYGVKMQQSFDLSQWHFYALRLQSSKVTAWVDDYSEELDTNTFSTELLGRFQIGRWVDHTSFYGAINVAQVMVYNRALSESEIGHLYAKFGDTPGSDNSGIDYNDYALVNGSKYTRINTDADNNQDNYPVYFDEGTREGSMVAGAGVLKFNTTLGKWEHMVPSQQNGLFHRAKTAGVNGLTGEWENIDTSENLTVEYSGTLPEWNGTIPDDPDNGGGSTNKTYVYTASGFNDGKTDGDYYLTDLTYDSYPVYSNGTMYLYFGDHFGVGSSWALSEYTPGGAIKYFRTVGEELLGTNIWQNHLGESTITGTVTEYAAGSMDKTYVYTVSGAGTTEVNGDYYDSGETTYIDNGSMPEPQ